MSANLIQGKFCIELLLCKHCNLKCRSCSRYCCLAEPEVYDYSKLVKDLRKLQKLDIAHFLISGGEPTLHPNFLNICKLLRFMFPNTYLALTTNGILPLHWDDSIFKTLAKLNIKIVYTNYKDFDYTNLIQKSKEFNVKCESMDEAYNLNEPIKEKFWTNKLSTTTRGSRLFKRHLICGKDFPTMWNGKIYRCCAVPFIDTLNKKYGTNFEVKEDDFLEIDNSLNFEKLADFWLDTSHFCDYCYNSVEEQIPWSSKNPQKGDYIE